MLAADWAGVAKIGHNRKAPAMKSSGLKPFLERQDQKG
jgi:hypothetical protein